MLATAAVLFSSQFLFNQKFEKECGSSLSSAMIFTLYTSLGRFIILFILNGFKMSFSGFSLLLAALSACNGILYTVASVKSFETVNLSAYSVFAMLGGMLLPALYGIIFNSESITAIKIICYIFIAAATVLTIDFNRKSGKKIYYISVFMLNGLAGVISVIHQSANAAVDSFSFLMLGSIVSVLISALFFIKAPQRALGISKIGLAYSLGFTTFCSIGNLFVLISLKHIPASVQYPVITGGTMIISLIISALRKEKIAKKNIVAVFVAFASTVLLAL